MPGMRCVACFPINLILLVSQGLFSSSHMKYMTDHAEVGDEEEPSLSTMVDAALKRLKSADNGFFLLVESGRIDHAHHQNYAMRAMEETIEFDQAVEV